VSGQLHAPAALSRRKNPRYPLDRRLGEPQSRSGLPGGEKILVPTGTRTPTLGRPASSQSLYRLSYPGSCVTIQGYNYYEDCSSLGYDVQYDRMISLLVNNYFEMM
jgi:hypothetical protein